MCNNWKPAPQNKLCTSQLLSVSSFLNQVHYEFLKIKKIKRTFVLERLTAKMKWIFLIVQSRIWYLTHFLSPLHKTCPWCQRQVLRLTLDSKIKRSIASLSAGVARTALSLLELLYLRRLLQLLRSFCSLAYDKVSPFVMTVQETCTMIWSLRYTSRCVVVMVVRHSTGWRGCLQVVKIHSIFNRYG